MAKTVHQLKISLQDISPPVWRRVLVPSDSKLADLHDVIQAAFGWYDCHLHGFEIAGVEYGGVEQNDEYAQQEDERRTKLSDVAYEGDKFSYVYDFGDYWRHKVVVEKVEPLDRSQKYPILVTGRRACPPEDCGGPWGYADLLEAIADPEHDQHDEMIEWVGGRFDPAEPHLAGFANRLAGQVGVRKMLA